ncbi:EpsG family protein, partial [Klebsiella michiganensis]|uniref:EpsG family protein n=1 Tax=Klebsiella michiganensis TaxID=1134687 RepID=UPI0025A12216
DNVEMSFNFLTNFFRSNNLGFDAFLFLYALLGLGLHLYFSMIYVKDEQGTLRFLIFLIPYFCYFFILWDLIQIRYSAGISFLMFGIFAANKKKEFCFF